MSHLDRPNDETYSHSQIDQIDQICDDYERELKEQQAPKIEVYLFRVPEQLRYRLLRDLVAVDFDFTRHQRQNDFGEYLRRFPDASEVLLEVREELIHNAETKVPGGGEDDSKPSSNRYGRPNLSRFEFREMVGIGGFGSVWRAFDRVLEREVAVKIPRLERVKLAEFLREARTAAHLNHPNIVKVYDVGEENGTSFIVTEFIDGQNLRDWVRTRKMTHEEVAELVAKLASAIQHAHSQGIIHRDLKLANVLMDAKGDPHIADFGLAKRESHPDSIAVKGQVLGTPAYMAPEQACANHDGTERRTDIYALGVIMYELLTGTMPFLGEMEHVLQQIIDTPPIAPRKINREIPKDLEAICLMCMAKSANKRYDSAQKLADDLQRFRNCESVLAYPAPVPDRVRKWFRRNRKAVTTSIMVAVATSLLAGSAIAWRYQSVLPVVPKYPVEITTEPPGCEIVVVAIDPQTREPDTTKIERGRGRTPLKMSLESGDYLVVAVLDSQRFNEVQRRVPSKDEAVKMPQYKHHLWWKKPDGTIIIPEIPIPRPDVTLDMAFFEGTTELVEPMNKFGHGGKTWRLPALFVDRHLASPSDLRKLPLSDQFIGRAGDGPVAKLAHYRTLVCLESIGKRLPTAAELFYIANLSKSGSDADSNDNEQPEGLSIQSQVFDLNSDEGEWTHSAPGAPFTGTPALPKSGGTGFPSYVHRLGKSALGQNPSKIEFRAAVEQSAAAGFRGVRSAKPRMKLEDFVTPSPRKTPQSFGER